MKKIEEYFERRYKLFVAISVLIIPIDLLPLSVGYVNAFFIISLVTALCGLGYIHLWKGGPDTPTYGIDLIYRRLKHQDRLDEYEIVCLRYAISSFFISYLTFPCGIAVFCYQLIV